MLASEDTLSCQQHSVKKMKVLLCIRINMLLVAVYFWIQQILINVSPQPLVPITTSVEGHPSLIQKKKKKALKSEWGFGTWWGKEHFDPASALYARVVMGEMLHYWKTYRWRYRQSFDCCPWSRKTFKVFSCSIISLNAILLIGPLGE